MYRGRVLRPLQTKQTTGQAQQHSRTPDLLSKDIIPVCVSITTGTRCLPLQCPLNDQTGLYYYYYEFTTRCPLQEPFLWWRERKVHFHAREPVQMDRWGCGVVGHLVPNTCCV